MSFETGSPETPETNPIEHAVEDAAIVPHEVSVADRVEAEALQGDSASQRRNDDIRAQRILSALKGGLEGTVLATALAANPADAAPDVPPTRVEAKQQESERASLIRGVASDPTLGTFTVEASMLGAKKDGTFGFEYSVVINGEKIAVQTSRRARNGSTFLGLEKGMQIIIPPGYGEGSDKSARLGVTDQSGKLTELTIERR